jgi:hypothetical protein
MTIDESSAPDRVDANVTADDADRATRDRRRLHEMGYAQERPLDVGRPGVGVSA